MRRYQQLNADEQAAAVQAALGALNVDPSLLNDPNIRPRLDQLATQRARAAFYIEPGDQIVTLPAPVTVIPPTP